MIQSNQMAHSIPKVKIDKEYRSNGSLRSETPYVNNQRHGVEKGYYDDGSLRYQTPFINGQIHGVVKDYYQDGSMRETHYYNGKEVEDFEQSRLLDKFSKW